jgi:hypothetical protein
MNVLQSFSSDLHVLAFYVEPIDCLGRCGGIKTPLDTQEFAKSVLQIQQVLF